MNDVSIKTEFELDEVLKEIGNNTITKEVLVSIIENMNPKDYFWLHNKSTLWNFTNSGGVLDDETIKVLLSGNYTANQIVYGLKLSPNVIDYILSNHLNEIDALSIIEYQTLSTEQLDIALSRGCDCDINSSYLGRIISESGNIEQAKHVVMNWDNYYFLDNCIKNFREVLFEEFSSIVIDIDPDDELIIFGFNRPMLCAQDVLDLKPCESGWKRVLKWTSLDGKKYSWNAFIALHIDANQDKISIAKSDLKWLANVVFHNNHSI